MSQIQNVDLNDAAAQLRDKIKLSFVQLIPDAQWDEMIKGELTKFLTPVRKREGGESSPFSDQCQEILRDKLRKEMSNVIGNNENQARWSWNADAVIPLVQEWLEKNYQTILKELFDGIIGSILTTAIQISVGRVTDKIRNNVY